PVPVPFLPQDDPEIRVGADMAGIQTQGGAVLGYLPVQVLLRPEGNPKVIVSFNIVPIEVEGDAVLGDCPVEISFPVQVAPLFQMVYGPVCVSLLRPYGAPRCCHPENQEHSRDCGPHGGLPGSTNGQNH